MNKIIPFGIFFSIFTIICIEVYPQTGATFFSICGKVYSEADSLPIENILVTIKNEKYAADKIPHTNSPGYFCVGGYMLEWPMFKDKLHFTLQFRDEDKHRKVKYLPKDTAVILDDKPKIIYLRRRR